MGCSGEAVIIAGQPLILKLQTYMDVSSGVSDYKIKYKKPDGTTGTWVAQAVSTYYIQASIPGGILTAGEWYVHAYPTFTGDSQPTPGARACFYVKAEFEK